MNKIKFLSGEEKQISTLHTSQGYGIVFIELGNWKDGRISGRSSLPCRGCYILLRSYHPERIKKNLTTRLNRTEGQIRVLKE